VNANHENLGYELDFIPKTICKEIDIMGPREYKTTKSLSTWISLGMGYASKLKK